MPQILPSLYPCTSPSEDKQKVAQMLFALEPPDPALHIDERTYDAVFMHRPFDLQATAFPHSYILWSHDAFDNNMTVGYNKSLAEDLKLQKPLQRVHWKNKRGVTRCIGMVGSLHSAVPFEQYSSRVVDLFKGCDECQPHGNTHVANVAVMGAFNADLLNRMKSEHGIGLYITGQVREHALHVAKELGIAVVAVGHERCEAYGLQALVASAMHVKSDPSKLIRNLQVHTLIANKLVHVT